MNSVSPRNPERPDMYTELFAEGPVLSDLELPSFDDVLTRAANDPVDIEAFLAITTHIERARAEGDLSLLYGQVMALGAVACMHDHMEQFADRHSENIFKSSHEYDNNRHHNKALTDDKNKKKKKKEKKKYSRI